MSNYSQVKQIMCMCANVDFISLAASINNKGFRVSIKLAKMVETVLPSVLCFVAAVFGLCLVNVLKRENNNIR